MPRLCFFQIAIMAPVRKMKRRESPVGVFKALGIVCRAGTASVKSWQGKLRYGKAIKILRMCKDINGYK